MSFLTRLLFFYSLCFVSHLTFSYQREILHLEHGASIFGGMEWNGMKCCVLPVQEQQMYMDGLDLDLIEHEKTLILLLFQDTSAAMGTSSVILLLQPKSHQYSVTFVLMKLLLLYQQTGKSAWTKTSADAPQSGQVKRKGPKSTKSQAKRQRMASPHPPPPRSLIHVELSPSSPEVQTPQAPSSPQPQEVPRPEEISAIVLEETANPVGSIISSVVSSIQTSTAPPKGKALPIILFADGIFFYNL